MNPSSLQIIFLISTILFISTSYAQHDHPVAGDIWCESVPTADTIPFSVAQPYWWMEYYMFNATTTGNLYLKVYPGMLTDAHTHFQVGINYCPMFMDCFAPYAPACNYTLGPATLVAPIEENNTYIIYSSISGTNYTIVSCDGPCGYICPNDCNGDLIQGYCEVNTGNCVCAPGYEGDDCGTKTPPPSNSTVPPHHKKVPFGSVPVFYSVVAGLPAVVLISLITGGLIYYRYRGKLANKKKRTSSSLIVPVSPSAEHENFHGSLNYGTASPTTNGHHRSPHADHDVFEEHEGSPFYGPHNVRGGYRRIGSS